jgi:hypothetical protein
LLITSLAEPMNFLPAPGGCPSPALSATCNLKDLSLSKQHPPHSC